MQNTIYNQTEEKSMQSERRKREKIDNLRFHNQIRKCAHQNPRTTTLSRGQNSQKGK